ncbi:MAG TPA: PSD1 and planctomycete cytochrome C domain-containing protein [Opitutaceae bacterium]|nr:PSD1 and planctomycete cytochrome C domain-containing protein [Opitutaceae bacterium]
MNRMHLLSLCVAFALAAHAGAAAPIDFARDIRPILADRCYDCHGAEKPKGGLQLVSLQTALKGGESGTPALIAGQSAKSELIARVTTADEDDVMPQKGDRLTADQIDLLKRWIDEGASWPEQKHWAYVKPVRAALPALTSHAARVLNPIDAFVFARLEREGLAPAPEVDKPRWLRRVSLDLVGLPPTPVELAAFMADARPRAYEDAVDRLLASPQYGERWARPWLDLARYADSHGFQRDDFRDIWPYRDWVIRAMNADMPFDQFTIRQLAGDLLPETHDPGLKTQNVDRLVATGFHRSAPTNVEAGTDQEEGRVNQVFDRVNTTAAVWLGSTLECAQCHNHKYDPFTQKEYYQFFAYFNQTARETDFTTAKAQATLKFVGPSIELPDPQIEARRQALSARIAELDGKMAAARTALLTGLDAWAERTEASLGSASQTHVLDVANFESTGESNHRILPDKSVLLVDDAPDRDTYIVTVRTTLTDITGFKLEALTDPLLPGNGPGRGDAERPNFVLNALRITAAADGGAPQPVKLTKASASFSQARYAVESLLKADDSNKSGWAIGTQFHREHWAAFETEKPLGSAQGTTFTFTLVQNFGTARTIGRLRLSALTGRSTRDALPAEIAEILRTPKPARTAAQMAKLGDYFVAQDKSLAALGQSRTKLVQERTALKGPQTLVMQEIDQPRASAIFRRGNFLDRGEAVNPGTPAILHRTNDAQASRLDLARWIVDRENPLVARVAVNRWWAEFFGRGIVGTPEDFGVKGEPPTHPELLDWLAVEFMERGWSMKHIHRLIALSATYRQSSRLTPALLARDDQNRLLARGPRFRLDAETIRDNALAVAGLLSLKQGGPPVRPYQPPGLWENKVGGDRVTYTVSEGEDAWRRGIYTVWKRSSPYPSFMNFDATSRTACTVRRSRSNTPLQALTLLNDPVYVEAARGLARRIVKEQPDANLDARIRHGFQLCLARMPTTQEVAALKKLFEQSAAAHEGNESTAWQAVATALLNLDETITKG